ncbi:MAG: IPTL-CTERM sorting domain-containing protein [Myxococcota bacterium]
MPAADVSISNTPPRRPTCERGARPAGFGALAIGLVLSVVSPAGAHFDTPTYTVSQTADVVYGHAATQGGAQSIDLRLDLYEPQGNTEPNKPALVLIHGGGFTSGDKGVLPFVDLGNYFASRGYVAVSINYRLAADDPPADPGYVLLGDGLDATRHAGIVDTKRAVRWLRANRTTLGIDPVHIFALGSSAGAFHAMTAGVTDDAAFLTDLPGQTPNPANHPDESAALEAVIDLWGGANPADFDASDPPLLIFHGTEDTVVDFAIAELMALSAANAGMEVEFFPLQGWGHSAFTAEIGGRSIADVVVGFLERHVFHAGASVPTLGAWSLALLTLLLGAVGARLLRQRYPA